MRKGNRNINTIFQVVYTLGIIFGATGMLIAAGGLVWICADSVRTLFKKISLENAGQSYETSRLVKRLLESTENEKSSGVLSSAQFSGIIIIVGCLRLKNMFINLKYSLLQIPGVTVPLSDLPLIILAVFLSQIVHELGHAVAAARYVVDVK